MSSVNRRRVMTKAQFLKVIAEAPDNALVIVPSSDHSYRQAQPEVTTVLMDGEGHFTEDFDEDLTPESEYGKRIPCIVIA